jgi:hypothetical protein
MQQNHFRCISAALQLSIPSFAVVSSILVLSKWFHKIKHRKISQVNVYVGKHLQLHAYDQTFTSIRKFASIQEN